MPEAGPPVNINPPARDCAAPGRVLNSPSFAWGIETMSAQTVARGQPYWWEEAPPQHLPQLPVLATADVVIMGAGYTGLSAAIVLARAGRSVHVFDRMRPGEGASTRNGGITSGSIRPSLAEMTRRFGQERADAILAESKAGREDLYRFIAEEKIDC